MKKWPAAGIVSNVSTTDADAGIFIDALTDDARSL
jgi:hypothetical protein